MIFYFSGTGNSKHAAEYLSECLYGEDTDALPCGCVGAKETDEMPDSAEAKETDETPDSAEAKETDKAPDKASRERLIDMAAEMKKMRRSYPVSEEERVGFVFPVYFYGVPKLVADFVQSFELAGLGPKNYVYAVLTCGGSTGAAGKQFAGLLAGQGYNLSAQYGVRMIDNYVPMSPVITPEAQRERIRSADEKLKQIAAKIKELCLKDANDCKGILPGFMTAFAYPLYRAGRRTKKFTVSDACIGCGKCARECPYGAISLVKEDARTPDGKEEVPEETEEKAKKAEAAKQGKNAGRAEPAKQEKAAGRAKPVKPALPVWEKEECILCLRCLHGCPAAAINYGRKSAKNGRFTYWR